MQSAPREPGGGNDEHRNRHRDNFSFMLGAKKAQRARRQFRMPSSRRAACTCVCPHAHTSDVEVGVSTEGESERASERIGQPRCTAL